MNLNVIIVQSCDISSLKRSEIDFVLDPKRNGIFTSKKKWRSKLVHITKILETIVSFHPWFTYSRRNVYLRYGIDIVMQTLGLRICQIVRTVRSPQFPGWKRGDRRASRKGVGVIDECRTTRIDQCCFGTDFRTILNEKHLWRRCIICL